MQYEDAPLAGARAQAILKPILLRRTKDSELEGQPLLQLPAKHIELVKLQFTPEEREVCYFVTYVLNGGADRCALCAA